MATKVTIEVNLTAKELANCFSDLDTEQQSNFFNEVARIVNEEYTKPVVFHLHQIKINEESKELLEEILNGNKKFSIEEGSKKYPPFYGVSLERIINLGKYYHKIDLGVFAKNIYTEIEGNQLPFEASDYVISDAEILQSILNYIPF